MILKRTYKYLIFCLLLALVGCSNEDFKDVPSQEDGKTLMLSLKTPVPSSMVTTRSGGNNEPIDRVVGEPKILLFSADELVAVGQPERLSELTYRVWIDVEKGVSIDRMAVLANYAVKEGDKNFFEAQIGDTYAKVIEGYKFASVVTNYKEKGLPMWGEVPYNSSLQSISIPLTRAVASVDVNLKESVDKFEFQKLHLCYYNKEGYIAPRTLSAADWKQENTTVGFEPKGGSVMDQIFLSEVDLSNLPKDKVPTVLVVEGLYEGVKSFYRIDFTNEELEDSDQLRYLSIKRNFKYQFDIVRVLREGWPSLETALKNKPSKALKYELVTWQEGIKEMWEQSGLYFALPNKDLFYSDFTTEYNAEVLKCQTNIDESEFKFESEYFNFRAEPMRGKDITEFHFWPKSNIAEIMAKNNINSEVDKIGGTLSAFGNAFNYEISLTKMGDYIEIYDIDADLFGKYQVNSPTNNSTDYIDLTVHYKAKRYAALRYRSSSSDSSFGFEGIIEFFPDKAESKARLRAYGTPTRVGKEKLSLDFGAIHKSSPIKKLDIQVDVLAKDFYRTTKVLFVTPNGGDYGALFVAAQDPTVVGKKSSYAKVEKGLQVDYSSYFPLDKYRNYHIIYYFDNASSKSSSSEDGESNNRSGVDDDRFLDIVGKYVQNGGTFIYCSDKRTSKNTGLISNYWVEKIEQETVDESNRVFSKILGDSTFPKLKVRQFAIKGSWWSNTTIRGVYQKNTNGSYTNLFDFGISDQEDFQEVDILVFPGSDDKTAMRKIEEKFNIKLYAQGDWIQTGILGSTGHYEYEPVLIASKQHPFVWMGSHRLFSLPLDNSSRLTDSGKKYAELLGWAVKKADNYKYFNQANKQRNFDGNKVDGYTISFTWD